jgi:hypothetical protein
MLPGHDPAVCDGLEQDLPGFRSPEVEGLSSVATVWEDAIDYIKGLTLHASRVNGPVSVATILWRFTYQPPANFPPSRLKFSSSTCQDV